MSRVGLTTTIPAEIIFAAGLVPVDLNNIFITNKNSNLMLEQAEQRGFPATLCSWVKGMYCALCERSDISAVVAVVEGDCSNALPLVDLLRTENRNVVTFSYPYDRDKRHLRIELDKLMDYFGVDEESVMYWMARLDVLRKKALLIDYKTWHDGLVSGLENHLVLVNTSDFEGDPERYGIKLDLLLDEIAYRKGRFDGIRLGYIGVPPIFSDLYDFLECRGARILYNEVQRQFAMPSQNVSLLDRLLDYTYPYSLQVRLKDIREQVSLRQLDGLIHYTQSFCHHQMEHFMLREQLNIPILMLEGDRPTGLDARTKIRIESFLEMLQ